MTGKIARAVYLLTLSSGRILACSILPIEDLILLFGKLISARVSSNLSGLGLTVYENEGRYYIQYLKEVIFEGDRAATDRFIAETLEVEERNAKKKLDDLLDKINARRNALAKWKHKFDSTFFNHLDGDLGIEQIKIGFQKQEYIGLGQGGHNPNALGETIRIKKVL